jgi:hypothetical protein
MMKKANRAPAGAGEVPARMSDTYLTIAERVLAQARQPLTAREILQRAYVDRLVPTQLHGLTQHKTLGARLSEDILARKERSAFFRTGPGQFFLRRYLQDASIPEQFRKPIVARRRQRELVKGRILSVCRDAITNLVDSFQSAATLRQLFAEHKFHYRSKFSPPTSDDLSVWSYVVVTKGTKVLTYRHGRFKQGIDPFVRQKSIGFFAPVVDHDADIFDNGDRGIVNSGLRAVFFDLDLPQEIGTRGKYEDRSNLECFIIPEPLVGPSLLAVVKFECPEWYEPVGRRLAINDLRWMDLVTPINSIDDFDPWSRRVFEWAKGAIAM